MKAASIVLFLAAILSPAAGSVPAQETPTEREAARVLEEPEDVAAFEIFLREAAPPPRPAVCPSTARTGGAAALVRSNGSTRSASAPAPPARALLGHTAGRVRKDALEARASIPHSGESFRAALMRSHDRGHI